MESLSASLVSKAKQFNMKIASQGENDDVKEAMVKFFKNKNEKVKEKALTTAIQLFSFCQNNILKLPTYK